MSTASINAVWKACCEITGDDKPVDKHAHLIDDMGIDSLGLAELVIQLEETYGEGVITVDDLLANPIVADIASKLGGGGGAVAVEISEKTVIAPMSTVAATTGAVSGAVQAVWAACCEIVGKDGEAVDASAHLMDTLGVDSLGLAELVIRLEETYGEGVITVDDIMDEPIVSAIAAKLPGGAVAAATAAPKIVPSTTPKNTMAAAAPAKIVTPALTTIATPSVAATPAMNSAMCAPCDDAESYIASSPFDDRLSRLESAVMEIANAVKSLTPANPPAGKTASRLSSPPSVEGLESAVASLAAPKTTPAIRKARPSTEATTTPTTKTTNDIVCYPIDAGRGNNALPADWIKTTHVGSLPRATGTELLAETIIRDQKAVGLSVINDGEWSRENYIGDMLSRIGGLGSDQSGGAAPPPTQCMCEMPLAADMRAVPTYAQRFTGGNGLITLNPNRVARADVGCTAHPKYLGSEGLMKVLTPFLEGLEKTGVSRSEAFWTVPSPGTLALFCEDRYFGGNHGAYVHALAEAVRPEYEAILRTGLQLQVDCPDLAMGRHTRYVNLTDAEFDKVAADNVAALNFALGSMCNPEQVRIHVCWGNYAGPHHLDIAAYSVWPHVGRVNCKYVLIEGANPRHGHEAAAFEHAVANGVIDTTKMVVVPGVIDTTAARVEHPALVAERLLRFVKAAGHPSRVMASTDCGFASTARSVAITADLAWRKIGALVEGAALATKLYLEAQAPVPTKTPMLTPTPYRVAIFADAVSAAAKPLVDKLRTISSSLDILPCNAATAVESLRWAVDFPLAFVAIGDSSAAVSRAEAVARQVSAMLSADTSASRRPPTVFAVGAAGAPGPKMTSSTTMAASTLANPEAAAWIIMQKMLHGTGFDRRVLAPGTNPTPLPTKAEVVVIGGGLLGMSAAIRLRKKGHNVVILEQRSLVGGIWSMHANSTSQVNSSEGGYCLKDLLPESSPRKNAHNRDHSTAAEVLADLAELGQSVKDITHTQTQVVKVLGTNGDYHVVCTQHEKGNTQVIACSGVVLAINDRVGMPRSLQVPGMKDFRGVMADGTSDHLTGCDWKGKRVVVFGMGAFAVENVRTALEHGAAHVTVVARRYGTICPKMIDYLNFVKPFDANYNHEVSTNVKQLKCWRDTYRLSGAETPECWPSKIKHDGHTISVSDIWFVASHMGKLATKHGVLERMDADGCVLSDGSHLACDIVVGCIGFERNTTFCEQLTGRTLIKASSYLDKNMLYLADAEIDESAFNSFFGSSVLEYAKFYTNVYVEGFERPEKLGKYLWGDEVGTVNVKDRKWTQYIAAGETLMKNDAVIAGHVATQVSERTKHFYRTMPPTTFVEVNRKEWEELHTRLNGGVPVPKASQLPYMFGDAAKWCLPTSEILG